MLIAGTVMGLLLAPTALADWTCFGILNTNPIVCSSHGVCTEPDTCVCEAGYVGANCESSNPLPVPVLPPLASVLLVLSLIAVGASRLMGSAPYR